MNSFQTHAGEENNLAKFAYLSGILGMFIILIMGYLGARYNVINGNNKITFDRYAISTLFVCALSMFILELMIRIKLQKKILTVSTKIENRNYYKFFLECLLSYAAVLFIMFIAVLFYKNVNEYGFKFNLKFYKPWFALLDIIWKAFLYAGLPYIFITRLFQSDFTADRKDPVYLLFKILIKYFPGNILYTFLKQIDFFSINSDVSIFEFNEQDKKIFLGLLVKVFFIPLMTVFFFDQFRHLVNNYSVLSSAIFNGLKISGNDFYNITFSLIFSLDVGLAWCGYTVSSRWIKNSLFSVEPTFTGWAVAALCYPPFRQFFAFYFSTPSENAFLSLHNHYLISLFTIISIFSYLLYLSATVVFGLRFSNLTHRGIITKGPYAIIRHPAYTAKNLSWWCVMLPVIIFQNLPLNLSLGLFQICGLLLLSWIYYCRAMTEERHLSIDEEYKEYCKKVKYRFIPGIF